MLERRLVTYGRPIRFIPLIAIFLAFAVQSAGASERQLCGETLIDALRGGGFSLYFRHVATDWSQSDHVDARGEWESCDPARMRQLSDEGRHTARMIGAAIRRHRIPIEAVLASPYCRTVETAELMGIFDVDTTTDIMNLRAAEFFGGREAIVDRARARLSAGPDGNGNVVLVAHGNVARAATGVYPEEGEMLVFQSDGDDGFSFVGRIPPAHWEDPDAACE